jgi:endonuclease/exonuclease/phosphatase family metal-dependent hydrolase
MATAGPGKMRAVQFLTWNLDGLSGRRLDERTEAAVFLAVTGCTLRQIGAGKRPTVRPPDVAVFQEVVDHTFRAHLRVRLPRAGYTLHPAAPPGWEPFEVVAVRVPARIVTATTAPLPESAFGRHLSVVDVDGVPGTAGRVRVVTAHFDSGPDQRDARIEQLLQVAGVMGERAVFGGDANLRDAEWEAVAGDVALTDAWLALGAPARLAATWRNGTSAARFDRVWLGSALEAVAMAAVGTAKLSATIGPPSDHLGLRVELREAAGRSPGASA